MQGLTRDVAQAEKHWNPKTEPKGAPEIPVRSEPGEIESERTSVKTRTEASPDNPVGKVLR